MKGGRGSAKPQLRFVKDRLWSVWSTGGENPLGGSPEGPRRPGRWTFLRKEVIEVEQKPIAMCRKLVQGRLACVNSKLPLGLREEQRVKECWKKGQDTQENYKDAMKLIREKTTKVKVQLEVNPATSIKVRRKSISKCINDKKRPRRVSILYCMLGWEHDLQG